MENVEVERRRCIPSIFSQHVPRVAGRSALNDGLEEAVVLDPVDLRKPTSAADRMDAGKDDRTTPPEFT